MLGAITILFSCQLAGEAVVRVLGIAFPGPVLGMGLMLGGLLVAGRSTPGLDTTADGILRNLSLLFVPAAVGAIEQADLIARHWLAIGAAVAVSTVLTLVATVLTFRAVSRLQARKAQ